jgi:hypothetical protein
MSRFYDALIEQDYRVFLDIKSIGPGLRWETAIQSSLEDAVEHGFVLLLLSPDYLCSVHCEKEREMALRILGSRTPSNIVPVIVRDPDYVNRQLPTDLHNLPCIDTTKGSVVQNITALLHDLKSRPMI